jgi:hypothetical protein
MVYIIIANISAQLSILTPIDLPPFIDFNSPKVQGHILCILLFSKRGRAELLPISSTRVFFNVLSRVYGRT